MTEDEGRTTITQDDRLSSLVPHPSSALVIGLGNPILGDDGVGWCVAEEVKQRLRNAECGMQIAECGMQIADCSDQSKIKNPQSEIDIDCVSLGGLGLMERMLGYDHVILIDAMTTGQRPVGSVMRLALEDLPDLSAGHTASAHDTSLPTALQVGRAMGAHLPDRVMVVAVETESAYDFSEALTPPVAVAVPHAADLVIQALRERAFL